MAANMSTFVASVIYDYYYCLPLIFLLQARNVLNWFPSFSNSCLCSWAALALLFDNLSGFQSRKDSLCLHCVIIHCTICVVGDCSEVSVIHVLFPLDNRSQSEHILIRVSLKFIIRRIDLEHQAALCTGAWLIKCRKASDFRKTRQVIA